MALTICTPCLQQQKLARKYHRTIYSQLRMLNLQISTREACMLAALTQLVQSCETVYEALADRAIDSGAAITYA